ncbi:hypothetical protein DMW99_28900 [Pseudomonas chlororaphis]|nr:hypothetical protein C1Y36_26525 [Pseudomonas sp. FW306-2-2C-D06C]PYC30385.1 hypothetical protein DMW99_28900 [Pseudomonas chlororaphis]
MKILRKYCRAEKSRMISRIITICLHEFRVMNRMRFFLSDAACLSNTPQTLVNQQRQALLRSAFASLDTQEQDHGWMV